MIGAAQDDLAEALTARIVAIDGVRGLFPSHSIASAVLSAVTTTPATALVAVNTKGGIVRISARLATDRSVSSAAVIGEVSRAARAVVGDRPLALQIELAHID